MPINGQIKEKEVQLIGAQGEKVGVVSIDKALELAEEANLDLVLVAPNAKPVVCKLMNYGKYKFEQAKKEKESRKNQKTVEVKELRVGPNIGEHDFKSFTSTKKGKKSTVRRIDKIRIQKEGALLTFTFEGNGFLYHMIRILVGTLLEVGMGERKAEGMPEILQAKNRELAGKLVPGKGLILEEVYYDTK